MQVQQSEPDTKSIYFISIKYKQAELIHVGGGQESGYQWGVSAQKGTWEP